MLNQIFTPEHQEKLQQWRSAFTSWLDLTLHQAQSLVLNCKQKIEKSFGKKEKIFDTEALQALSKDVLSRVRELAPSQYDHVSKSLNDAYQQLLKAANSPRVVDCRKKTSMIFSEIYSKIDPLSRNQAEEIRFFLANEALILMKNKHPLVQVCFERLKELQYKGYNQQQFSAYEEILNALNYEMIKNHIVDDGSKTLNLKHCHLTRFPGAILLAPEYQAFWASLKSLILEGNHLQSLPPEISQLVALEELKMNYNKLRSLPSEIGSLHALKVLEISYNSLACLPPEISQLKELTKIEVDKSKLQNLPAEIEQLLTPNSIEPVKEIRLAP